MTPPATLPLRASRVIFLRIEKNQKLTNYTYFYMHEHFRGFSGTIVIVLIVRYQEGGREKGDRPKNRYEGTRRYPFNNGLKMDTNTKVPFFNQLFQVLMESKGIKRIFQVKRIQSVPLIIGQFLEAIDQDHAIVGSTTGYFLSSLYEIQALLQFKPLF